MQQNTPLFEIGDLNPQMFFTKTGILAYEHSNVYYTWLQVSVSERLIISIDSLNGKFDSLIEILKR